MKFWSAPMLGTLLASGSIAAQTPRPVSLELATIRRLAITTAPVIATTQGAQIGGFARVLDPIPLAQLDADMAVAAAAAEASAIEARRSRALFSADETVSRKVAETAAMQARGDAARLMLLRRRLGLEWGPAITRLTGGQRASLVSALASGRAALVRIDSAGGSGQAGLHTAVLDLGDPGVAVATILGPARSADARLQSPGLIGRVSGARAALLSTGLSIPARLGGSARAGASIPAAAVLRVDGATWVYVQDRPGVFSRRRLGGTMPVAGGRFAATGVRPGERVVTSGAAALYAAERGGGPAVE